MSEAWIMELLQAVREVAGKSGLHRLAEHLDDAVLIAASEFHERIAAQPTEMIGANGRLGAEDFRGAAGPAIH
jgi:hypothetical protein